MVPIFLHHQKLLAGDMTQELYVPYWKKTQVLWRLEIGVGRLYNFQESLKITKGITYALYLQNKL